MSSKASVSSDSHIVCIACIAASLPDFCTTHSWSEQLASTTSLLATLITHFPQILLKTSPTPIGLTALSLLSSGIRRLAATGSMVLGSMYFVHRVLVIVAIVSRSLVDDCLKDLQARILLKPFASTPDRPPAVPFVIKAACLTISPLISVYTDSGYWSSKGLKSSEPNLADCRLGCFCFNCDMTLSVKASTPPLVVSLRKRCAELIWPCSTSLAKTLLLLLPLPLPLPLPLTLLLLLIIIIVINQSLFKYQNNK